MGSVNDSRPVSRSLFPAALAFGVLWGSAEATFGHVLHAARVPGLAGLVMFPAALFFLARAFEATGRLGVLPAAAAIAASLKLVDALLPGTDLWAVLNPSRAILLEGLAVTALFAASGKPIRFRPAPIALAALSWRVVFVLGGAGGGAFSGASTPRTWGFGFRPEALLLEVAGQTIAILVLARFVSGRTAFRGRPPFRPHPAAAAVLVAAALAVGILL